jgi:hypothetical protein
MCVFHCGIDITLCLKNINILNAELFVLMECGGTMAVEKSSMPKR